MNKDTNPHPAVQPWSKGPLFPAVIARIDEKHYMRFFSTDCNLIMSQWELSYPGMEPQRYNTREDAEQQARGLNRAAKMRAAYREQFPQMGFGFQGTSTGRTIIPNPQVQWPAMFAGIDASTGKSTTATEVKMKSEAKWREIADLIQSVVPRARLEEATAENNRLKSQLHAARDDLRTARETNTGMVGTLMHAQTANRSMADEVKKLRSVIAAFAEKEKTRRGYTNEMRAAVANTRSQLRVAELNLAEATGKLAKVEGERNVLYSKLEKLRAAIGHEKFDAVPEAIVLAYAKTAP